MHEDVPSKAIAACFGLSGFVISVIAGIFCENPVDTTLSRAIPALFICYAVGYVIGVFTTRAISENIQAAARDAAAAAAEAAETAAKIAQQEAATLAAKLGAHGGKNNSNVAHCADTSTPAARRSAA
ncbi:MAG: hypothetical protein QM783_14375 [Phycisphaerales bacterium]